MSFRDLLVARASRLPKSYVSQPNADHNSAENSPNSAAEYTQPKEFRNIEEDVARGSTKTLEVDNGFTSGPGRDVISPMIASENQSQCHNYLLPTLEIKRSKTRGRGLWSKEYIKAGSVLISVKPRVHVLSRSQLQSFCAQCSMSCATFDLKKCMKCKVIYYCGPACQNDDWTFHKSECEALGRWASTVPEDTAEKDRLNIPAEAVRCLARIVWGRKKEGIGSIWWREINEMQSHHERLAQSVIDSHVHLAHALVRFMGIESKCDLEKHGIRGIGELVDLISKFTTNAFTLTTPSLSPIGVSVSPIAALVNHSCDPNVSIVFPRSSSSKQREPLLQVVAIRDILPNSELFTSYVDITLPTSMRQKDLQETYNFTCDCTVCFPSSIASLDWRERIWCPRKCGGTCPVPTAKDDMLRCSKCGQHSRDVEKIIDALHIGQGALDKARALQTSDLQQAVKLTNNIIPFLVGMGLTPSSHPLLAIYRLHQSFLIISLSLNASQELLDEAVRAAARVAAGLSEVLHVGHPVRAIALAELGKLLAVDEIAPPHSLLPPTAATTVAASFATSARFPPSGSERLQLALQTLQQALGELRIGFGRDNEGGEVGRDVRDMIVNLEKELGVWRTGIKDAFNDALAENRG